MSIIGGSARYAEFITSLSILEGTVDINWSNSENSKMEALLLDFNSKLDLSTQLVFSFPDTFRDGY